MIQCDLDKCETTMSGDTMTLLSELGLIVRSLKDVLMEVAVSSELEADLCLEKAFEIGKGEEIKRRAGFEAYISDEKLDVMKKFNVYKYQFSSDLILIASFDELEDAIYFVRQFRTLDKNRAFMYSIVEVHDKKTIKAWGSYDDETKHGIHWD